MSGGIRDDASLEAALATGCARVNLGTAALESPEWCAKAIAEHGDRIAVGLDVRGTTLAARGWTQEGGDLWEVLARLDAEGCARYVVTDVRRDGTLTGPNLELLQQVCAATDRPVVASGGVSSLDDLRALAALVPLGVEGAIVGKALYAGAFTLPEALAACARRALDGDLDPPRADAHRDAHARGRCCPATAAPSAAGSASPSPTGCWTRQRSAAARAAPAQGRGAGRLRSLSRSAVRSACRSLLTKGPSRSRTPAPRR